MAAQPRNPLRRGFRERGSIVPMPHPEGAPP